MKVLVVFHHMQRHYKVEMEPQTTDDKYFKNQPRKSQIIFKMNTPPYPTKSAIMIETSDRKTMLSDFFEKIRSISEARYGLKDANPQIIKFMPEDPHTFFKSALLQT